MKKVLLFISAFTVTATYAQDCTKLFISEYAEGKENNKALELYNPTASAIDLSEYILVRYSNGATDADTSYAIQLTGMIQPYSTHVGVFDKRNPAGLTNDLPVWLQLQGKADAFYCPTYEISSVFAFNGNDALVLAKGSRYSIGTAVIYDIFGKIGEDPGVSWTTGAPGYTPASGGAYVTKDKTLIRKPTVLKGVTNPVITVFNALAEYDSLPTPYRTVTTDSTTQVGNWNTLGSHSCNCAPLSVNEKSISNVTIYPNPSNGLVYMKGMETIKSVAVYNSLGQKSASFDNNYSTSNKIDLSGNKGVYFIRLTDKDGLTITEKVIIK